MKKFLLAIIFSVSLLLAGAAFAESDLPEGYTLCETDAVCTSLGAGYKCLPQKYACGPASTCVARVCLKESPANSPSPPPSAEDADPDKTRCERKGGRWQGTVEGRGRLTGCNMPTKDGGKPCKNADDCESVCLRDGTCYGWQQYKGCGYFKGYDQAMCID